MAMGSVNNQHIDPGINQPLGALEPVTADGSGGGHPKTPLVVFSRIRIELGFFDILHRDQSDAMALLIDHQKFFNPVLVKQALGLFVIHALREP